ncbi:hypothetical protein E4U57_003103 [Claviceps arundinis]|uniref:Uncharacterized protein n=1 Tax=Claviceps arundinis TaxID=1623583 RepID=A0A9P7SLJ0_9HYPO|nr:hypothetical protein E4U57_003103 [Claviceps arundinis]KAG5959850.1 hypothetical protein E4U56_004770 [Claviceps arundinis]
MAESSGARGMLDFHEMTNALLNLQGEQMLMPIDGETGPEETRGNTVLWAAPIRVQPPRRRLGPQYRGMIGRRTVNAVLTLPGEQLLVPADGRTGPKKADNRKRSARALARPRRNRGKNAIIHEQLQQANRKLQEMDEILRVLHEIIRQKTRR